MNKRIVTISFAFLIFIKSWADEGMWLPLLLGQQVYGDMAKKGLKLTKEQLYSINKSSLKDAIIIFGGGCTGEIVSNQGLIFTNHHCGYDAIANASTVEHNYLRDGFYAASHAEEIPTGLSVQFLLRIDDVTKQVMDSLKGLSGADRVKKQTQVLSLINKSMSDESKNITTRISPLFKGNQFLAFVYQVYKDIRLVGAPPESVGKFGGDTDNWEWPRHTGDFSVFRVYADANNQPAAYAENNKPLTPKWSLPVSIKPLKDGDYAMIWGYPGGTNRYESSYGIKLATDTKNPTLVELRDVRLKYMFEEMKKDPAIKLKLASSYAGIANYWKFFDGETKQLLKYDVYGQKVKAEQSFQSWANGKPEYESIFSNWKSAYDQWIPFEKHRVYMIEGIMGSSLAQMASTYMDIESMLKTGDSKSATALKSLLTRTEEAKADQDITSDKNIMAAVTKMFYNNVAKDQQPTAYFAKIEKTYGSLTDDATYKKMADDIFSKTMFLNDAGLKAFAEKPSVDALVNDPAYEYVNSFYKNYSQRYLPLYQKFTAANQENGRLYLKGIMEKDPAKAKMMYPDATFTMRVSYGQVKSYKPRDAVQYDYVTTSKGLLEKYKPGDYEFDLPSRQIDLIKKKDFGQYVDPIRKDLVIGFITTNDITGGNSGSPVLNGKGELIGLAFDGNYEALSHKLAFDKDLNRTICVDIRYVLWCIDKLGGASNLIKELKIMK